MLRMSYCDHFSSVVHPSVNIFKRLFLWSPWANFAQISYGASLGWGNEKVLKWSRSPCPYMVKTFKNLLLQNRGCLGAESLHKSSGTGGLPKLLKKCRILTFDLFTARSSLRPYAFVWEKPLNILFSKTEDALWLNLYIYHRKLEVYQSC